MPVPYINANFGTMKGIVPYNTPIRNTHKICANPYNILIHNIA